MASSPNPHLHSAGSWYAVHTQPHGEFKSEFHLNNQDFQVYLPKVRKMRRHARKSELVPAPLFNRYLFVHLNTAEIRWQAINSTVGVSAIVSTDHGPTPVPGCVIDEILAQEDEDGFIQLAKLDRLQSGDRIRILDGVMEGNLGIFSCSSDRERALVLLDILGRQVKFNVPRMAVGRYP